MVTLKLVRSPKPPAPYSFWVVTGTPVSPRPMCTPLWLAEVQSAVLFLPCPLGCAGGTWPTLANQVGCCSAHLRKPLWAKLAAALGWQVTVNLHCQTEQVRDNRTPLHLRLLLLTTLGRPCPSHKGGTAGRSYSSCIRVPSQPCSSVDMTSEHVSALQLLHL